jgi:hypothetical protein
MRKDLFLQLAHQVGTAAYLGDIGIPEIELERGSQPLPDHAMIIRQENYRLHAVIVEMMVMLHKLPGNHDAGFSAACSFVAVL